MPGGSFIALRPIEMQSSPFGKQGNQERCRHHSDARAQHAVGKGARIASFLYTPLPSRKFERVVLRRRVVLRLARPTLHSADRDEDEDDDLVGLPPHAESEDRHR